MFGNKPTVNLHVSYMLNKARKKLWTLRNVKRAGMQPTDLLKIFNTCIRPCLEYVAPVFHPMLTKEMSNEIENIQKRACKIIFGWNSSYSRLVQDGVVQTLEERRENLTVNFAKKSEASDRFKKWFPDRQYNVNVRNPQRLEESFARTERMRNSPLYYMRRALNRESAAN